ncbi:heterokaryon incompatibility protein-domain-containing protein [Schizothecium vesticola]|uniref:Heterokaryon incompatibility protein-domain-containing protein n=1 Tax=Schizothecium vesticola TaxID=314040 RepID=A0AA40BQ18_9PEZI|nr:heterokaryon incompatibility protein-domain-containing protein [Schizothecium vesticola]
MAGSQRPGSAFQEFTKPVEVNYTEKPKEAPNGLVTYQTNFKVTTNLEAALHVLRATLSRPVLWADAICIDQSDLDEKASQVPLMAEIYSQAVQTIIWLGEADATTKMPNEVDLSTKVAGIQCTRLRPLAKGQARFTREEIDSDEFYKMRWGIQALLARPFFRRAWVLQEIGLALSEDIVIHCGQAGLWWSTFLNLYALEWRAAAQQGKLPIDMERNRRLSLPSQDVILTPASHCTLPEIWSYMRHNCSHTKRGSILELIIRRMDIQATDPRDQIFALLALARECQAQPNLHEGFKPNYHITIAEAYLRFTRAVIETAGNTIVFSAIDTFNLSPTREERGLPSWVPEYDRQINLRRTFAFLGEGRYRAAGGTKIAPLWPHGGTIAIRAIFVDRITSRPGLGPYNMSVHTENLNDLNTVPRLSTSGIDEGGIRHLWQVANRGVPHNPIPGQDLIETFILTLIACRREYFNRDLVRSVLDLPDLVADFAAFWLFHHPDFASLPAASTLYHSHDHLRKLGSRGQPGRFGQRLFYTCHERSFVVTEHGLLALVPTATAAGDDVAVFQGGNVPYIVRNISHPSGKMMDGQAGECDATG